MSVVSLQDVSLKTGVINWLLYSPEQVQQVPPVLLKEILPYLSLWQLYRSHDTFQALGIDVCRSWQVHCDAYHGFFAKSYPDHHSISCLHRQENLSMNDIMEYYLQYGINGLTAEMIGNKRINRHLYVFPESYDDVFAPVLKFERNRNFFSCKVPGFMNEIDDQKLTLSQQDDFVENVMNRAWMDYVNHLKIRGSSAVPAMINWLPLMYRSVTKLEINLGKRVYFNSTLHLIAALMSQGTLQELIIGKCPLKHLEWYQLMLVCAGHSLKCLKDFPEIDRDEPPPWAWDLLRKRTSSSEKKLNGEDAMGTNVKLGGSSEDKSDDDAADDDPGDDDAAVDDEDEWEDIDDDDGEDDDDLESRSSLDDFTDDDFDSDDELVLVPELDDGRVKTADDAADASANDDIGAEGTKVSSDVEPDEEDAAKDCGRTTLGNVDNSGDARRVDINGGEDAVRMNAGDGDAVRMNAGDGDAMRMNAGDGDAMRMNAGGGEAEDVPIDCHGDDKRASVIGGGDASCKDKQLEQSLVNENSNKSDNDAPNEALIKGAIDDKMSGSHTGGVHAKSGGNDIDVSKSSTGIDTVKSTKSADLTSTDGVSGDATGGNDNIENGSNCGANSKPDDGQNKPDDDGGEDDDGEDDDESDASDGEPDNDLWDSKSKMLIQSYNAERKEPIPGLQCVCGDKKRQGLKSLNVELYSNKNAFRALWCVLPDWHNLEVLTLNECQLNRDWFWAALARQVAPPYNLHSLHLNVLGDDGQGMELDSIEVTQRIITYFPVFIDPQKPMKTLSMSFNSCEGKCFIFNSGEEDAVLCEKFELTHHFNDDCYNEDMSRQVRKNTALKQLAVQLDERRRETMSAPLIRALNEKQNSLLETLAFSDMRFDRDSFGLLIGTLPEMKHLKQLFIERSLTNEAGVLVTWPQFVSALQKTPTLSYVSLNSNNLRAHAAKLVASLVDVNGDKTTHLHVLRLDGNEIPMNALMTSLSTVLRRWRDKQEKLLDKLTFSYMNRCGADKVKVTKIIDGLSDVFDSCDFSDDTCSHCMRIRMSQLLGRP